MCKLPDIFCKAVVSVAMSAALLGQTPPAGETEAAAGKASFSKHCAGCHGVEAEGGARGPSLTNNRHLRGRTTPQIHEVIQKGISSAGMPAFDLPAAELNALAVFVRSLNSPAADYPSSGDV